MLLAAAGWLWSGHMKRTERIRLATATDPHEPVAVACGKCMLGSDGWTIAAAQDPDATAATACNVQCHTLNGHNSESNAISKHSTGLSAHPVKQTTHQSNDKVKSNNTRSNCMWQSAAARSGHWPGVSVVLPVKGCRQYSEENWVSQLSSTYGMLHLHCLGFVLPIRL